MESNYKHTYLKNMRLVIFQKYERALYYYESCVTIPTLAVSHIMLEAYKKFLLVSLIVHGDKTKDMTSLPKYTSPVINKYLKPLCASYQELVAAYYSNQTTELEVVISLIEFVLVASYIKCRIISTTDCACFCFL